MAGAGRDEDVSDTHAATEGQRLDQWLWFSRLTKSRSIAQCLILEGKVRVNRAKVGKSSHGLKAGDVITVAGGRQAQVVRVVGFGHRRGPATEARLLYEDLSERSLTMGVGEEANGESAGDRGAEPMRDPGSGRPTKRERRETDRLRGR